MSDELPAAESAAAGDRAEGAPPYDLAELAGDQPVAVVERGGVRYTLLGTAHVSKSSAATVTRLVESGRFDAVAIELDAGRYRSLSDPDAYSKMDLFKVLREGKAGMLAVNLALSAFQQRMAEQFGVEPGAEMKAAMQAAKAANLPCSSSIATSA